jgi:hypothetical protein
MPKLNTSELLTELKNTKEKAEKSANEKMELIKEKVLKNIDEQFFEISAIPEIGNKAEPTRDTIEFKIYLKHTIEKDFDSRLILEKLRDFISEISGVKNVKIVNTAWDSITFEILMTWTKLNKYFENAIRSKLLNDADKTIQNILINEARRGKNEGLVKCDWIVFYDRDKKWLEKAIKELYEDRGINVKLDLQVETIRYSWQEGAI